MYLDMRTQLESKSREKDSSIILIDNRLKTRYINK